VSQQTDHERDMERLAVRLTWMNQAAAREAETDPRNRDQHQQEVQR
jgi:hypothetical protein